MRATCHDERFSNIHEIDISHTTFYPFVPMYIYIEREGERENQSFSRRYRFFVKLPLERYY